MLHPAGEMVGTKVVVQVISTLGCALEGAEVPGLGEKCELYIDWHGAAMGVEGLVVSRDAQGRAGVKFLSLDKDIRKRLNDLCNTLRIASLSSPLERETDKSLAESLTARQPVPAPTAPLPQAAAAEPAAKRERRRVPRYVSDLRARLLDPATGTTLRVKLITLSVLGGCVEGTGLPAAGLRWELETEWEGKPLRLHGDIVWNNKQKCVGLKFAPLDADTERVLRQVCANLRLQPMAPPPAPTE